MLERLAIPIYTRNALSLKKDYFKFMLPFGCIGRPGTYQKVIFHRPNLLQLTKEMTLLTVSKGVHLCTIVSE